MDGKPPRIRKLKGQVINAVDLFCGAGGTSSGLIDAVTSLGYEIKLTAINHWDVAIATHAKNHEDVRHFCQSIETLNPTDVIKGGRLQLLVASPECFPAGTLVLTTEGYRPIESIRIGDLVLTHRNRWRRVTSLMISLKDTVTISGQGHTGLETTDEHPIYTRQRKSFHRPVRGNRWKWEDPVWTDAGKLNELKNRFWATPSKIEALTVPEVGGRGFEMTAEFMWLVGLWLAEGTVRIRPSNSEICISTGKHEADTVAAKLGGFNSAQSRAGKSELRWRRREVRTATLFETGHDGLARWLVDNFGRHSHGKRIPAWVYGLEPELRTALLTGYLQGDGSVERPSYSAKQTCQTVSRALAYGIKTLAATLGMRPSVHDRTPSRDTIEGRKVNIRPAYGVQWTIDPKRKESYDDGEHHWTRIKGVTPSRSAVEVFNLSVEEDESYVVEGIVVHNCTHHSRARGGKPRSDQKRADAWLLMRWIEKLYIENILIENVREFVDWGPLTAAGKPDKRHKGEYFKAFIHQLRINYTVDWKVINCADHGDPTTRERFFLIAKRGRGKKIVWPERTHASRKELAALAAEGNKTHGLIPWVPAREIIDWKLEGKSIFGRKTPLKPNTMRRIFAGLKKYSGINIDLEDLKAPDIETQERAFAAELEKFEIVRRQVYEQNGCDMMPSGPVYGGPFIPHEPGTIVTCEVGDLAPFIVPQFTSPDTRDVDRPLGAITTSSRGVGLAEGKAFQLNLKGTTRRDRHIEDPTFTQATANHQALVSLNPYLIKNFGGSPESRSKSIEDTLGTVAATFNHHYLVQANAFFFNMAHTKNNDTTMCKDTDETLQTIAGKGMFGLVEAEPFTMFTDHTKANGSGSRSVEEPVQTIMGAPRIGVAEPFIISAGGPELPAKGVEEPMRTILTRDHQGVVKTEFVSSYHGGKDGDKRNYPVEEPIPTLDTSNRFGVVESNPFIVSAAHGGNTNPPRDIEEPLGTILGAPKFAVAEPCIVNMKGQSGSRSVDDPTFGQTTKQHQAVVEPFVLGQQSGATARPVGEPIPTVAGKGAISLITGELKPYIVKFYGNGDSIADVGDPLATVTSKDRFGLCIPTLGIVLDIRFRMLQPHELAAAMSFDPNYEFTGTREEKVKQIGNSVPLKTAKALCQTILLSK